MNSGHLEYSHSLKSTMKFYILTFLFFVACVTASNVMRLQDFYSEEQKVFEKLFGLRNSIGRMNKDASHVIPYLEYYMALVKHKPEKVEKNEMLCTSIRKTQELTTKVNKISKCDGKENTYSGTSSRPRNHPFLSDHISGILNHYNTHANSFTLSAHIAPEDKAIQDVNCYDLKRLIQLVNEVESYTCFHEV